jgi:hypothetical protein
MAKRGRPPKDEATKRGVQISFRVSQALRDRLEAARREGGTERSLSAEIEQRLRHSFEIDTEMQKQFGAPRYQFLRVIAEDILSVESHAGAKWFESRFAYDEVKAYIETFLGHLRRPSGRRVVPKGLRLYAKFPTGFLGGGFAMSRLFELAATLRAPNAADKMPLARGFIDPVVASGPFAGRLAQSITTERDRIRSAVAKALRRKQEPKRRTK